MRRTRVLALVCALLTVTAGAVAAAVLAARRLESPPPPLSVRVTTPATWTPAPGTPLPIPAPRVGSMALDGLTAAGPVPLLRSDAGTVRPIASVTKTMTALAVLEVHPLNGGEPGPLLTITATDVADYRALLAAGGSVAPVTLGEKLSERDALLGLMLPSANNLALTLARWVDGSAAAFVARLNARAAAWGLTSTHFADPDGLSSTTTSTAADLVRLGERAVASPALLSVVSTSRATLPDGTQVTNLDALLGAEPGWLGVKTGWTPQAGGCLLFASRRPPVAGAPSVTLVGAVLGQPPDAAADPDHPELGAALASARAATRAAYAGYTTVSAGAVPISGSVRAPWGPASMARLVAPDHLLVRFGAVLQVRVSGATLTAPAAAGSRVALLSLTAGGITVSRLALVLDSAVVAPTGWWRLLHS